MFCVGPALFSVRVLFLHADMSSVYKEKALTIRRTVPWEIRDVSFRFIFPTALQVARLETRQDSG